MPRSSGFVLGVHVMLRCNEWLLHPSF